MEQERQAKRELCGCESKEMVVGCQQLAYTGGDAEVEVGDGEEVAGPGTDDRDQNGS